LQAFSTIEEALAGRMLCRPDLRDVVAKYLTELWIYAT